VVVDREPELITVREAARRLGVHENTVRNLSRRGVLPPAQIPGSRVNRFDARDVERLRRQRGEAVATVAPERNAIGPELIDASQLDQWPRVASRDAQQTLPELIRRLLSATPGITSLSMRAGEGVALSGWDGTAESAGTSFLPAGHLCFEIGVAAQPKRKADEDWENRRSTPNARARRAPAGKPGRAGGAGGARRNVGDRGREHRAPLGHTGSRGQPAVKAVKIVVGLIADTHSPTLSILSALSAFTVHAARVDIEHWAIGFPYAQSNTGLARLPGVVALVLLGVAALAVAAGLSYRVRSGSVVARPSSRLALVLVLVLATPLGECVYSAIGNHIIGVRDMAASWPFLALSGAALASAVGRRTGLLAGALAAAAFALGAVRMFEPRFERPDYAAAAAYVATHATTQDVVIDVEGVLLTPGPLTGFDVAYHGHSRVVRGGIPAERNHPFNFADRFVSLAAAEQQAVREAAGARIFVVAGGGYLPPLPGGYRQLVVKRYPNFDPLRVSVWSR